MKLSKIRISHMLSFAEVSNVPGQVPMSLAFLSRYPNSSHAVDLDSGNRDRLKSKHLDLPVLRLQSPGREQWGPHVQQPSWCSQSALWTHENLLSQHQLPIAYEQSPRGTQWAKNQHQQDPLQAQESVRLSSKLCSLIAGLVCELPSAEYVERLEGKDARRPVSAFNICAVWQK